MPIWNQESAGEWEQSSKQELQDSALFKLALWKEEK